MIYDKENIFAKILRGEIPCDKIYEDEYILSFNDINPQAKIHVLGIPKFPCTTFSDFLKNADNKNITSFFKSVQLVINNLNIEVDDEIKEDFDLSELAEVYNNIDLETNKNIENTSKLITKALEDKNDLLVEEAQQISL